MTETSHQLFYGPPKVARRASQLLGLLWSMMLFGLRRWCYAGMLVGMNWFTGLAWAGGSGLNTLVVLNQNSANSVELGNYFCERRQVPPENVLRIAWPGGNLDWDVTQFQTNLLQPILQAIASRGLTNQIQYVVLSMDIPFQTHNGLVANGTTSGLFYGIKTTLGNSLLLLTNSYAASETAFAETPPVNTPGYSFLTTMLTAGSLAQAKALVDQGVNSDATFPTAAVVLAKTDDPARTIREIQFNKTIFDTRLRGDYSVLVRRANSPAGEQNRLGYQTGLASFTVSPNTFVPGAMADSLTSFGGIIFGPSGQTPLLAFIHGGAAGSYGTVSEPTADLAKFPSPQNYFYQARGFSLAECYYQSLKMPYQGLIVGEPLAAPFALPATGGWIGTPPGTALGGTAALAVDFTAADPTRPLQRVDLFVDGKFFQTLTNIAPAAGNQLSLLINGQSVNYSVAANATLASIATGLAAAFNAPAISNATKTLATAFGDRVELRYLGTNRPTAPSNLRIVALGPDGTVVPDGPVFDSLIGTAPRKTTFVTGARSTFLDPTAAGTRMLTMFGTVQVGAWAQLTVTKTNGAITTVSYTNQLSDVTPVSVLSNLVLRINASAALQGADGIVAEDFTPGILGTPTCNLVARSPGLKAAGVKVSLACASPLAGNPGIPTPLTANLTDLQPRNHLYLTAGAAKLTINFSLNTTALPDGYHELTAVAYEGSHVRTQARVTLPVRIQNTPLTATLNLLNLGATNSVAGNYQIQVVANANNIASITLYSTGGALGTVMNQSAPTFTVAGTTLRAGAHSFYAVVQNLAGQRYRTLTQTLRFANP
jgi:uncharacterized protein (TIGR03790 family)